MWRLHQGLTPSPENAPGNNDEIDGDSDGASETLTLLQGEDDPSYDFGFYTLLLDLGDLPENLGSPSYPTLFTPGPANTLFPDGGDADTNPDTTDGTPAVWLGLTVDSELNGQPSANAMGDGVDEDGMVFAPSGWIDGQTSVVTVTLNSSASNITVYYGLWIDWNANGSFSDAMDGFYNGSGVTGSPVNVPVSIAIPAGFNQERLFPPASRRCTARLAGLRGHIDQRRSGGLSARHLTYCSQTDQPAGALTFHQSSGSCMAGRAPARRRTVPAHPQPPPQSMI